MLGRRRGGSSLIPGKGDAALAAAPSGKPPSPRCPPAAAHLTPNPGQLCPGIPWPHVASRRLISRSAEGSCPAPPPPPSVAPKLCPAGLLHASCFPQRPRFRVLGFAVLCSPPPGSASHCLPASPFPFRGADTASQPPQSIGLYSGDETPIPLGLDFCLHLCPGFASAASPPPSLPLCCVLSTFPDFLKKHFIK